MNDEAEPANLPVCRTLALRREGPVLRILLNRPTARNALSDAMVADLGSLAAALEADRTIRVVVLRGAGGTFCAGGDLSGFVESRDRDPAALAANNRVFGRLLERLDALPQLLIGVVEGAAFGGGIGLVCVTDITLCEAGALGFDDVARILRRLDAGFEHTETRVRRGGGQCGDRRRGGCVGRPSCLTVRVEGVGLLVDRLNRGGADSTVRSQRPVEGRLATETEGLSRRSELADLAGRGVDQDDMVAFLGLSRASAQIGGIGQAPAARRSDQLVPQGSRLRYVQCPQGPLLNSQQANVCAGL